MTVSRGVDRALDGRAPNIAAELRRAGIAEVDDSTRRRAEYSTDASLYRVVPEAVVFPRAVDELAAVVDVCRRTGAAVTARGAGTSIAGNAVGPGVVIDCSRHLNRILAIDPDTATAVVQPGVVLDDLQRAAAPHGLRFGPDPSTPSVRIPRAALRPHLRQRPRPRHRHWNRGAAAARHRRRHVADPGRPARDRRRQPRADPHRARPVQQAGVRLLAGTPVAGEQV
jgi:hypothetical protein